VTGDWAWRAEAAYFPNRPLQVAADPSIFEANALETGAGVDRRAGDFTLSASLLVRVEDTASRASDGSLAASSNTDVSVVGGFSRSFARERFQTRLFTLLNPKDRAAFVRGVFTWKPLDDLALESSVGWFAGEGNDLITRFADRDFFFLRMTRYFGL
jgi:hypothetical protein